MVSFIARTWDKNGTIRYMNCPNEESLINIKKILYNYDNIKKGQDILIIVEGVFDCIRVKSIFSNVIATLGTEVTSHQIELLVEKKAKNYYIMFDADVHITTTKKKAKKLADYLSAFGISKVVELPFGKDPADLKEQEIKEILNNYGIN